MEDTRSTLMYRIGTDQYSIMSGFLLMNHPPVLTRVLSGNGFRSILPLLYSMTTNKAKQISQELMTVK